MLSEKACRDEVWRRAGDRCRCSGDVLERNSQYSSLRGEVHHLKGRNVRPDWKRDPDHQILLSKYLHLLATGVWGGRLLRLFDPDDPEMPATDATKPILFVRKDKNGVVLWTKIR